MRGLVLVTIDGPLLGLAMDPHVRDFLQPPGRHVVQVRQRLERPPIQQVLFRKIEWPFHFPLRTTSPRPAGHRPVTVVRGEGQETRVVHRLVSVVIRHHDFHVVVQAAGRHASQIFKRPHVLANRRREVLRLDEPQILTSRIAQQITEQVHPPASLAGEVDRVGRVIHLGLLPRSGLETLHEFARRAPAEPPQLTLHRAIAAGEAEPSAVPRASAPP